MVPLRPMRRLAGVALVLGTGLISPPLARAEAARFEQLAVHPQAVKQSTATGKALVTLFPWQGRLYPGYGDYGANTGPIAISPFDPVTGTFSQEWLSDTEAIESYRLIRGTLYAPASDPRRDADYASGEPWADHKPLGVTHGYDMVTLDGSDLWLVGSQGSNAAAWRSLDDGAKWTRVQSVGAVHGVKDDFARFYFAGVLDGRLYVQAHDFYGGAHPHSRVFDGRAWADGPNLLAQRGMGWRPEVFAGRMVYRSYELGGTLMAFDGQVARHPVGWNAQDVAVDGDRLYALRTRYDPAKRAWEGPQVVRTRDLAAWDVLDAEVPTGARSLAWLGGQLYLGASDARLFRLTGTPTWQPAEARWNAAPSARFVRPVAGARFTAPATIELEAAAADPDGEDLRVVFWNGSTKLGEATSPPYRATWTGVLSGTYRIGLRASDAAGDYVDATVSITVAQGPATPTSAASPRPTPLASPSPTWLWLPWASATAQRLRRHQTAELAACW